MKKTYVEVKKGKDLSAHNIRRLNKIWKKAFKQDETIKTKKPESFADDTYFFVRGPKKELLSVGRLLPVRIRLLGKIYRIQGIADIVSMIERKGYGKILMTAIYKHLSQRKQTGVGFCSPKNSRFYHKCGFKIAKKAFKRFLYKNAKGKIVNAEGDALYIDGRNGFMEKLLAHPKEKIILPQRPW